jgi:hypothetical protein
MKHRPWCWRRRLPIPYVQRIIDGVVDFRKQDIARVARCAHQGLCQFCGTKLDEIAVFIGGRQATHDRLFREAPFHEDCARFALTVCPYLRSTDDPQFATFARNFRSQMAHFPLSEGGEIARAFVVTAVMRVEPVGLWEAA